MKPEENQEESGEEQDTGNSQDSDGGEEEMNNLNLGASYENGR